MGVARPQAISKVGLYFHVHFLVWVKDTYPSGVSGVNKAADVLDQLRPEIEYVPDLGLAPIPYLSAIRASLRCPRRMEQAVLVDICQVNGAPRRDGTESRSLVGTAATLRRLSALWCPPSDHESSVASEEVRIFAECFVPAHILKNRELRRLREVLRERSRGHLRQGESVIVESGPRLCCARTDSTRHT
jgi:hypothetical protein